MQQGYTIIWLRRDLRIEDNAALYHALKDNKDVIPIFIFDRYILDLLEDRSDKRVDLIFQVLDYLKQSFQSYGGTLHIFYTKPLDAFKKIAEQYPVKAIYANHDYEPYAIDRDKQVGEWAHSKGIMFQTYKDQVIFEKQEIVKQNGEPYTVFTPFSRKWKEALNDFYIKPYPVKKYLGNLYKGALSDDGIYSINQLGFQKTDFTYTLPEIDIELIRNYAATRNIPGIQGTSRLSMHLRFGTVSIRKLAALAAQYSEVWLNELIWRDFFMTILYHFPYSAERSFKPAYDFIPWRNNVEEFNAWCEGRTGYPIVDAGMRELNTTGWMHNRVRMVVASFLTKHLLIDWRWGEAYFASKLLDYDMSANIGGWQWAAGSGCDAAPYFRVFNPTEQTKKFDPQLKYIRHWVPELDSLEYPHPIVEHKYARERVLSVFKEALKQ